MPRVQYRPGYGALDDARLAALAEGQHGVVSRRQLYDLGYSRSSVARRVEKRRLLRIHRGVYAVGHRRLAARGRWMAAVLACGPGAVLSHREAAALHDLRPVGSGRVHVTATSRHNMPGHPLPLGAHLGSGRVRRSVDGIPVTSLARTYLDIAEVLNHRRLIEALEAGQRQNKLDVDALEAAIARNPGRRGITPLQAALAELADDPPLLQSDLERAFRALIRAHGLPEPQYNVYVEGLLVDAVWPEHRLVVEVDGWNYHRTKRSFEEDRRRDRKLLRARWRVARFTGDDVNGAPDGVAEELSELLRDGPWPPPAR